MNFLSQPVDSFFDQFTGGRDAAPDGPGMPSEVNPVPIVYGRPGWVVAAPVTVDVSQGGRNTWVTVRYSAGEGLLRVPDAVIAGGYLDAWSTKYDRATEADQIAVLGQLAERAAGEWPRLGSRVMESGEYDPGWSTGHGEDYNAGRYAYTIFQGVAFFTAVYHLPDAQDYIDGTSIPELQYLPNGKLLHDPRIDPEVYADNYLYVSTTPTDQWPDGVEYGRDADAPRWDLGGVAKGWSAENMQYKSTLGDGYRVPALYVDGALISTSKLGDSPDNNPALCVLDYLTAPIYGAEVPVSDINTPSFVAAADYCDALAPTYSGGPTQPQMSCDLELSPEDKIADNLKKILATCRGKLGWIDGQYHLAIRQAGQPIAFEIRERHIVKRRSLAYGNRSDRYNRVVGAYVEPAARYQERQIVYPDPQSSDHTTWLAEDGGELNENEITLDGCTNAYRAADLLSTALLESRAGITAEYECTLELLQVTGGDVVRVYDDKFDGQLFWVSGTTFDFERRRVTVSLRQQDDRAYDNLVSSELNDPGTDALPDDTLISAPTGLAFNAGAFSLHSCGSLTWEEPASSRVTGHSVVIVPSGQTEPVYSAQVSGDDTALALPFFAPGAYVALVRAVAGSLQSAEALLAFDHTIPTDGGPSGLQLSQPFTERAAVLEWDALGDNVNRYLVVVMDADDGAVLYSETVAATHFEYTFAKNEQAGLRRRFTVAVAGITVDGNTGGASSITVENSAPAVPVLTTTAYANSIQLQWVRPSDPDHTHTVVYWRLAGGAWSSVEVSRERAEYTITDLASVTTYELYVAHADAFGEGAPTTTVGITTTQPTAPVSVQVNPGVNQLTLIVTPQNRYEGIRIWYGDANGATGNPVYAGGDLSIVLPGLLSGTEYHIWYRVIDADGVATGAEYHVVATTNSLNALEMSGLSDWATQVDPVDAAFIDANLTGDAIASEKIANITAAKITSGVILATIGVQSGGSIETVNNGYKTGLGVYDDNGTIYTLMTADASGNIVAGITADGTLYAQNADITGTINSGSTITGATITASSISAADGFFQVGDTAPVGIGGRDYAVVIGSSDPGGIMSNTANGLAVQTDATQAGYFYSNHNAALSASNNSDSVEALSVLGKRLGLECIASFHDDSQAAKFRSAGTPPVVEIDGVIARHTHIQLTPASFRQPLFGEDDLPAVVPGGIFNAGPNIYVCIESNYDQNDWHWKKVALQNI